jgi:hypothetical protein
VHGAQTCVLRSRSSTRTSTHTSTAQGESRGGGASQQTLLSSCVCVKEHRVWYGRAELAWLCPRERRRTRLQTEAEGKHSVCCPLISRSCLPLLSLGAFAPVSAGRRAERRTIRERPATVWFNGKLFGARWPMAAPLRPARSGTLSTRNIRAKRRRANGD